MSCYIHLQCHDHDPPIQAWEESGQHMYDVPRVQELLALRDTIVQVADAVDFQADSCYDQNTIRFLRQHPHCRLRIIAETGEDVTYWKDDK